MRNRCRCLSFLSETDRARKPDPSCDRALVQSTPGSPRLRQQVVWRIEKAARQYPAASRAQNLLISKKSRPPRVQQICTGQ